MKKVIGTIAIVLIVALGVGLLGYFTKGYKDWSFNDKLPELPFVNEEENDVLNIVSEDSDVISFSITDVQAPLMSSPGGLTALASKAISATITPSNAVNKSVDWYVFWATPESAFATGKDVREYVNVIPNSDGSLQAMLECYQHFQAESILVKCITRVGGFEATCTVTFGGKPTSLAIDTGLTSSLNGDLDTYYLGTNQNYSFAISGSNCFGYVGDGYKNYSVTLSAFGTITVDGCVEHLGSGGGESTIDWNGEEHNIQLDSIKDNFITASISNSTLNITTNDLLESYYASRSSYYYDVTYVDRYVRSNLSNNALPAFIITVKELNSNVSTSIYVRLEITAQSASIAPVSYEF